MPGQPSAVETAGAVRAALRQRFGRGMTFNVTAVGGGVWISWDGPEPTIEQVRAVVARKEQGISTFLRNGTGVD